MDALTLEELAQSLNESYMLTGDRIDVIGFDACLMGMAEVAYEIREWTDYLVFSEETIPWDGWPYDTVLSDLAAFPSMGPAEFSSSIVTRYMEYYGYNGAETMSALDVGAMGELYQAIDALGEAMIAELDNSSDAFAVARNYTQSFSEYSYIDLYDFAAQLIYYLPGGTLGSIPEWIQNIISVAVIAEGHGQYLPGANGLSIYFPTWWWSSQYDDLAFSIDLSWDDFLMSYLHVTPSGPDAYEPDDTFDQASWIEMNETQEHSISNSGADIDWVKFNITSPQVVAVYTTIPNNVFGDTVIALFNSSGVPYYPLATNDDYYNLSSLIQMYLTPDTYYVEVWSLGQYSEISTYYLTLSPALPNDPPVIYYVQWYPSLPYPGDYVYFEIGAYDPDGYIDHFEWDFGDGTGIWYAYSSWISHYFSSGGYYNGSVTAVDNQGGSTTMMLGINVVSPPVAVVTLPDVIKVGTPATFSGTDSYDPSGGIITDYWWWFSDGWNGSGPEVTRVFDSPGTYSLYLQVYSSTGRYGYTEVTFVVVTPLPPIAVASYSPSRPLVGETVIFDGSHSTDLDNGTIPTFIWEYGDGAVGEGLMATHAYSHAGTYQVKLTVVDEDNLVAVDTVSIVVVSSPVAAFEYSPASLPAGQEATFYAYGSYDESGISQCTWSFGDGTYAQGWQVSHKYSSAGTYEVKLTVQNSAGVTSSVMKSIVVSSKPAASGLGSPQEPVALSGSPVLVFDVMSASLLAGLLVSSLLLFVVSRRAKRPISEKLDR
jgi:PKD repeat protein